MSLLLTGLLAALVHVHASRLGKLMENLEQKIDRIERVATTLGAAVAKIAGELKNPTSGPTEDQLARLDRIADTLQGNVATLDPATVLPPENPPAPDATTSEPTSEV